MASQSGVSLSGLQDQMAQFMAQMQGQMQAMQQGQQPAPIPAAQPPTGKGKKGQQPRPMAPPVMPMQPMQPLAPPVQQFSAPPVMAPPVQQFAPPVQFAPPMGLQQFAAPPVMGRPAKTARVCGQNSPNGPCRKCNGPFSAVTHYSLQAVMPLDNAGPLDMSALKGRRFLGISVDQEYWGNVVIVGFGKDNLNFRPHNLMALAQAMGAIGGHVQSTLTSANAAHLLAPPSKSE